MIREMTLNLSPGQQTVLREAEMSDYGGAETGGSEIITCIGRTAPMLDLC